MQTANVDSTYQEFKAHEKRAMKTLLGWGIASTIGGLLLSANKKSRDFGTMTAGWGAVNTAIAGVALSKKKKAESKEAQKAEMQKFGKILAINSGLDLGYIAAGTAMSASSNQKNRQFGAAIVVQGAWLLVFDSILWLKNRARLRKLEMYSAPKKELKSVKSQKK